MKVVEVNVGKKIEYSVSKNKITFADELMLNCEKLERDNDECVDICIAKNGMITKSEWSRKTTGRTDGLNSWRKIPSRSTLLRYQ